jgi:hypothetical protein
MFDRDKSVRPFSDADNVPNRDRPSREEVPPTNPPKIGPTVKAQVSGQTAFPHSSVSASPSAGAEEALPLAAHVDGKLAITPDEDGSVRRVVKAYTAYPLDVLTAENLPERLAAAEATAEAARAVANALGRIARSHAAAEAVIATRRAKGLELDQAASDEAAARAHQAELDRQEEDLKADEARLASKRLALATAREATQAEAKASPSKPGPSFFNERNNP